MALPVLTFNQFLTNFINTITSNTPKITNLTPGSIAYAFGQAVTGASTALQQLMVHVANITRLATSFGSDVDSFVADYGMSRLPAVSSTGQVTLSRTSTTAQLIVPVTGAVCQSAVSNTQFNLVADMTQPNYNLGLNAYVFSIGVASITATVQAAVAGTSGNLLANTLTQIVSGFAGVVSITNLLPFTNGFNPETDAALKLRFQLFIASLAGSTLAAVEFAISTVQSGLTFKLIEGLYFNGTPFPGGFTAVVDDGSGAIAPSLLTTIFNAILPIRAAGISFTVVAPTDVTVNITVNIHASAGFSAPAVVAQVQANLASFVNGVGVGNNCGIISAEVVVSGTAGVGTYSSLMLNGAPADVGILDTQLARAGTITVTSV